ncbi:MAG: Type 1 glutamine amidotransferase-like domain-containing protein [Woeseia sp.]
MKIRLLLGPQRPVINLGQAMRDASVPDGPVAVIAAGWQEAESDVDDVATAAAREVINLALYRRADEVFAGAPELQAAYRERQEQLQELQRLYAQRLRQTMAAARQMLRASGSSSLVGPEQRHAIAQLRALDRHHLQRLQVMHAEFDAAFDIRSNALLAQHAAEIAAHLANVQTVVITGGNVAVLLNRLQLFDLGNSLASRHLVAWSAGAMALTERVVLFHDNAPQGRRNPEIFGAGLGIVPHHVLLPDAKRRLRTGDRIRLALFSRRFAPSACIALDSGGVLRFAGDHIAMANDARQIAANGRLRRVKVS